MSARKRVAFDFSREGYERLSRIAEMSGVKTSAEAVRNALRLYEWFLEKQRAGDKIAVIRDHVATEVEILF